MTRRESYGLGTLMEYSEEALGELIRDVLADTREASFDMGMNASLVEMAFDRLLHRIERREAGFPKPD